MSLEGFVPTDPVSPAVKAVMDKGSAVLRNTTPMPMASGKERLPIKALGDTRTVTDLNAAIAVRSKTDTSVVVETTVYEDSEDLPSVSLMDATPSDLAILAASSMSLLEGFGYRFDQAVLALATVDDGGVTPAQNSILPNNSVGRMCRLAGSSNYVSKAKAAGIVAADVDNAYDAVVSSRFTNMPSLRWFINPALSSQIAALNDNRGRTIVEGRPLELRGIQIEWTHGAYAQTNITTDTEAHRRNLCQLVDTSKIGVGYSQIAPTIPGTVGFIRTQPWQQERKLVVNNQLLARYGGQLCPSPAGTGLTAFTIAVAV